MPHKEDSRGPSEFQFAPLVLRFDADARRWVADREDGGETILQGLYRTGALRDASEGQDEADIRFKTASDLREAWFLSGRGGLDFMAFEEEESRGCHERIAGAIAGLGDDADFVFDVVCRDVWPGMAGLPKLRGLLSALLMAEA